MKRLAKGTARDLDALEHQRDETITRMADAITRLRRAQTIADKYLSRLFRLQATIDGLRKNATAVAARLASGKGQ